MCSAEGIATDPRKLLVVQEAKAPTCEKELRSFLGLTGYYRRYCPHYSVIAAPLYALLQKRDDGLTIPELWTSVHTDAYDKLKLALVSPPTLAFPNIALAFFLYTDASMDGMGNILMQRDSRGQPRVIAYGSRTYRDSEKNYDMPNKECLSVVNAFKQYRQYLLGCMTYLMTDCSSLVSLLTTKSIKNQVPEGQIFRWMLALQQYTFEVLYLPGKLMPADALSRAPIVQGPPTPEIEGESEYDPITFNEVSVWIEEFNEDDPLVEVDVVQTRHQRQEEEARRANAPVLEENDTPTVEFPDEDEPEPESPDYTSEDHPMVEADNWTHESEEDRRAAWAPSSSIRFHRRWSHRTIPSSTSLGSTSPTIAPVPQPGTLPIPTQHCRGRSASFRRGRHGGSPAIPHRNGIDRPLNPV